MAKKEAIIKTSPLMASGKSKRMELQSSLAVEMMHIVSQFDMAYVKLKSQWNEPGGIPEKEGQALVESAQQAVQEFSNFMVQFSDEVGFKYYPPKKLEKMKADKI